MRARAGSDKGCNLKYALTGTTYYFRSGQSAFRLGVASFCSCRPLLLRVIQHTTRLPAPYYYILPFAMPLTTQLRESLVVPAEVVMMEVPSRTCSPNPATLVDGRCFLLLYFPVHTHRRCWLESSRPLKAFEQDDYSSLTTYHVRALS